MKHACLAAGIEAAVADRRAVRERMLAQPPKASRQGWLNGSGGSSALLVEPAAQLGKCHPAA